MPSRFEALLMASGVIVAVGLVVYPVMWLIVGSLFLPGQGVSLHVYREIFQSYYFNEVTLNTLILGSGATFVALLIGLPLAWLVARTDVPFKTMINLVALIPFITPPVVGAIAWSYLANPRAGILNRVAYAALGVNGLINIYSMPGLIWVMGIYVTPFVFLVCSAALKNMDPLLENAGHIAGSGTARTAIKITLPLITPAIFSAAVLALIQSIEIFAIPAVLGIPGDIYVLPVQIWQELSGAPPRYGRAAALGMCLMIVSAAILILQRSRLARGQSYATIGGKSFRPKRIELGRWKFLAVSYAALYLLASAGLPYLVLIYGVFIKQNGLPPVWRNLTLSNLTEVFDSSPLVLRSIKNSLFLSVSGSTLALLLALVVAYVLVKTRIKGRGLLDFLTFMPFTIPGTVIAVGMIWAYIRPPFRLYGTFTIMLLAYMTRYLPLGTKTLCAALSQVHTDLERSAAICGATFAEIFRGIVAPLVLPGMGVAWILMFVAMMRELSASIMLFTGQKETLAVALYLLWEDGFFAPVCILSLIIALISIACVYLAQRIFRVGEFQLI